MTEPQLPRLREPAAPSRIVINPSRFTSPDGKPVDLEEEARSRGFRETDGKTNIRAWIERSGWPSKTTGQVWIRPEAFFSLPRESRPIVLAQRVAVAGFVPGAPSWPDPPDWREYERQRAQGKSFIGFDDFRARPPASSFNCVIHGGQGKRFADVVVFMYRSTWEGIHEKNEAHAAEMIRVPGGPVVLVEDPECPLCFDKHPASTSEQDRQAFIVAREKYKASKAAQIEIQRAQDEINKAFEDADRMQAEADRLRQAARRKRMGQ